MWCTTRCRNGSGRVANALASSSGSSGSSPSAGATADATPRAITRASSVVTPRPVPPAVGGDAAPPVVIGAEARPGSGGPPCDRSDVEAELHDVAVGHHVVLALDADLATSLRLGHRPRVDQL